jgi:uncharacterized protein YegL
MNNQLTEIAFLLDRSGSMTPLTGEAIAGFNSFLREQQAAPGQARLTLVLFDHEYEVAADGLPVQEVVPLDGQTYSARGSTALLDALGTAIDALGARLAAQDEAARPGKVIVAVLTDGMENASEKFTWKDIARRIKHQSQVYHWEFLFLGANQDAIATASRMNIAAHNASNYVGDGVGLQAGCQAASRKMTSLRACAAKSRPAEKDLRDAQAPLGDIVKEEDEKKRGA